MPCTAAPHHDGWGLPFLCTVVLLRRDHGVGSVFGFGLCHWPDEVVDLVTKANQPWHVPERTGAHIRTPGPAAEQIPWDGNDSWNGGGSWLSSSWAAIRQQAPPRSPKRKQIEFKPPQKPSPVVPRKGTSDTTRPGPIDPRAEAMKNHRFRSVPEWCCAGARHSVGSSCLIPGLASHHLISSRSTVRYQFYSKLAPATQANALIMPSHVIPPNLFTISWSSEGTQSSLVSMYVLPETPACVSLSLARALSSSALISYLGCCPSRHPQLVDMEHDDGHISAGHAVGNSTGAHRKPHQLSARNRVLLPPKRSHCCLHTAFPSRCRRGWRLERPLSSS